MIKVENIETSGWEAAFRGMRNPLNSWDRSDSHICTTDCDDCEMVMCDDVPAIECNNGAFGCCIGQNDFDLATRLIKAGSEHRKFLRMIHVSMDITAPMFFWSEHDTYKIATTRNSCSKMHTIHVKSFKLDDFAHEGCNEVSYASDGLKDVLATCERLRLDYNATHERKYWRALIELLPEGYMMRATWDGSMETMLNILHQRDHHKLKEEWSPFRQAMFDNVPYCKEFYEVMYGKENNNA